MSEVIRVEVFSGAFGAILGAIGSFVLVIWNIIHAHRQDKRQAAKDHQDKEDWIITQIKEVSEAQMAAMEQRYNALKADFDELAREKDKMEHQLQRQIALKEEENRNLRETLDAYRAKYGGIQQ